MLPPSELAERYRRKAQKFRALAEGLSDPAGRAALLRAADGYDEMAKRAAARGQPDVPDDTPDGA